MQVQEQHEGHAALGLRLAYSLDETEFKDLMDLNQAKDIQVNNDKVIEKPFKLAYQIDQDVEDLGGRLYLAFPRVPEELTKNPFISEERRFPIDYGFASAFIYRFTLQIPPGYEVESIPENIQAALDDQSASFTFKCNNNNGIALQVLSRFQINKNIISNDKYLALKELYNQVVNKLSEQIVLKEKSK